MTERAVVFDKAAWHLPSVRELGLADHQALVHGGLFFGWAVDRGLHAPWLEQRTPEAFARYRRREITGPALLAEWDGAILDDMFNDVGLAFAATYFDPKSGSYFSDYLTQMARGLPSEFHVPDDAASARSVSEILDRRFSEWRAAWDERQGRPDLRGVRAEERDDDGRRALDGPLSLGVLAVSSGVPLPGGPLGVRVARPDSLRNVERALSTDRLLALLIAPPGRALRYAPGDLLDVGIVAKIRGASRPPERPGAIDVTLFCLARIAVQGWEDPEALVARCTPLDPPDDIDEARLDTVRTMAAELARKRSSRGEPPGMLALAAVHRGELLVDLVARELLLGREEALLVLEAPDLGTRLDVVSAALAREL